MVRSSLVNLGLIHWFTARNTREEDNYGTAQEFKTLDEQLAEVGGWNEDKGGSISVIKITDNDPILNGDMLKKALAERQARLDELEELAKKDDHALRLKGAYESIWVGKGGKLIHPEYVGNTHNRRGRRMPYASILGISDAKSGYPEFSFEVPIRVVTVRSLLELRKIQAQENGKTVGAKALDPDEFMTAARPYMDEGKTEAFVQRELGLLRGYAQKLYGSLSLDINYPEVHFERRLREGIKILRTPPKKGESTPVLSYREDGPIPWGPLHPTVLNRFVARDSAKMPTHPVTKREYPFTTAGVEAYIQDLMTGDKAPTMLVKKEVESLAKNNPNEVTRRTAGLIAAGNSAEIAKFARNNAFWMNTLLAVTEQGEAQKKEVETFAAKMGKKYIDGFEVPKNVKEEDEPTGSVASDEPTGSVAPKKSRKVKS